MLGIALIVGAVATAVEHPIITGLLVAAVIHKTKK